MQLYVQTNKDLHFLLKELLYFLLSHYFLGACALIWMLQLPLTWLLLLLKSNKL